MNYFRIKYGYGTDEFISVDETELPMAVRAHVTGKRGIFKEGTISGDKIIAIVPDFQRAMGWARDYELRGEDYADFGQKRIDEHRLKLQKVEDEIKLRESIIKSSTDTETIEHQHHMITLLKLQIIEINKAKNNHLLEK